MTGVATAIAVTGFGGALLSSSAQKGAASDAAASQERQGKLAIEEQRRQFDKIQEILKPFVDAGTGALGGQQDLIGLGGDEAQQSAIDALKASPEFTSLVQTGEEGLLQNASATGGLRGGNTAGFLSELRPNILTSLINRQFGRLGGLTSIGQNAAAGTGNAGMRTGENISKIRGDVGDAQASSFLSAGRANATLYGDIAKTIGTSIGEIF